MVPHLAMQTSILQGPPNTPGIIAYSPNVEAWSELLQSILYQRKERFLVSLSIQEYDLSSSSRRAEARSTELTDCTLRDLSLDIAF